MTAPGSPQPHPATTPEAWAEWIRTPADRHAVAAGCYFDLAAAMRVRTFVEKFLVLTTGHHAGKSFILMEWQWRDVIGRLFGWKQANGLRRFTKGYLSTPKKQSKTTILSALALYLLLADGEHNAEVYSAASDRDQAGMIYREAVKMIDASPALQRVCRYRDSTKTLIGKGRSFYRALSADARRQEGRNASAILFDELHAQPDRFLWDALRYAGSSRRQPLMIAITTAGDGNDPEHICREIYEYSKRTLSGEIIDPSFYACIYEAGEHDDWTSEATWKKANPAYGITVTAEQFRADFTEAKESPAKENSFRRYRLNQWVSSAQAWLSMEQWDACPHELDLASLEGRECIAGLDLSSVDDLTALVLLFPMEGEDVAVLPFFYLPEANIGRLERKHRVPYRQWERRGAITLSGGNVVDYSQIREHLAQLSKTYRITQVGMDRAWQGQALESQLIEDGHDVVPVGAGWRSQDLPAKRLEALVRAGRINHGNHPILRWNASNVVCEIDRAGNYSINKKKSRSKIDGIAALLTALFVQMNSGTGTARPYYEDNPLIVLEG